ncbi:hypothetical protein C7974DRAFT_429887 [Boeremia exigua]|uniref:uncharacterized protein n=1 Tax=Boeremia exigua TaxID=749465 RepID=UPI001E8E7571|nr:uncharacterized protein C7974DRAFT_429887 [Boeremia exigua]KAH6643901.1 hypothetical protein C7974DRAFT_429887 [Boeremia exigua]
MKGTSSLVSLLAALPAVRGAAFAGPSPTSTSPNLALGGMSSKPTAPPSIEELRKRQTNLYPETCGWIDGVYSNSVTCPGSRTCMQYTGGAGMIGCCDSANTVDCGWASSCIDAAAYRSGCGTSCVLNTFIQKCTESTLPYCATWTFPSNGVIGYGCVAYSETNIATVLQRATDDLGATTSMTLATVVANPAVTGSGSGTSSRRRKTLAIGVIVGIVVVAIFVICCIAVGIFICLKKKRKQREIAASAQAMAAVHATRPQSQFPPQQQGSQYPAQPPQQQAPPHQMQMQQPSLFHPSANQQGLAPAAPPYFPHGQESKPGAYMSVQEYPSTPVSPVVSSPSTPAPVYAQPHGVPPPMPVVSQYQMNPDAHEVDAVSVPHVPGQGGQVHEIGNGK